MVQRTAAGAHANHVGRGRGPASRSQDDVGRAEVQRAGAGQDRFGQAQGAHGAQVPRPAVRQNESVGHGENVRVRQVRRARQTRQTVRVAVPAQPFDVAQERGHDAAEPRDGHEHEHEHDAGRYVRQWWQQGPVVAKRQRHRSGAQEKHKLQR